MPWSISLCVYKSPSATDVGHAFATVSYNGTVCAAAGLSPGRLPVGLMAELLTVVPGPGRIYSEWDSLQNQHLRSRSWDISEQQAIRVMNKINADRRTNISPDIPDGSLLPTSELVRLAREAQENNQEWAGGPNYALLWSNCASYAVDLVETAGIPVGEFRPLVPRPGALYNKLA